MQSVFPVLAIRGYASALLIKGAVMMARELKKRIRVICMKEGETSLMVLQLGTELY